MIGKALLRSAFAGIGLAGLCLTASAQVIFNVTMDTSALAGGSYYAEFSLSDGTVADGTGPSTANTATLNTFTFGGGSAGAVLAPNIGNASGDMGSTITLADGDPGGIADLAQAFTPGSTLSFDVALTEVVQPGTPDEFVFRLLNSSLTPLGTADPDKLADSFVRVDITSTNLGLANILSFGGQNSDGRPVPPPAPIITLIPPQQPSNGTPEPGALALLAGGGIASIFAVKRRRK